MTTLAALVSRLRAGDAVDLPLDAIPYAGRLGVVAELAGDRTTLLLPFAEPLIGAPGRIHGGVLAGLLELAAIVTLFRTLPADQPIPRLKPITVTTDFMREGTPVDTRAAAVVTRLGRRVANLRATAWQADPARPIAAATMTVLLARD